MHWSPAIIGKGIVERNQRDTERDSEVVSAAAHSL